MSRVFETEFPLAFGDVDQAKILYYPRFLHYCHMTMERFSGGVLGVPYAELLDDKHLGFPAVACEVDFRRPFPYGVIIAMRVSITEIGGASFAWRYRARVPGDEEDRAEARVKTVCVDMRSFRPVAIPDWIRGPLGEHLEER